MFTLNYLQMRFKILFLLIFISLYVNAQNDCLQSVTVCGNSNFSGLTADGFGNQEELSAINTCGFGENNSIWLKLSINTGGTLGFILTPESTDIEEDFDFYIFGPNTSCGALGTTIRCSTTNPLAQGAQDNLTGMNDIEADTSEGPGPNGNSYVKWLTVANGDSYFLVIDRPIGYSNFSIQWTGTAVFNQAPIINIPVLTSIDLFLCDDSDGIVDGFTIFDLSINSPIIKGIQPNVVVTYHESQNDATLGINAISNPSNYPNVQNTQTIYVRLTNTITNCFSNTSFEIKTNDSFTLTTTEFSTCDTTADGNDANGKVIFNLADISDTIFANQDISNFVVKYYRSTNDATINQNQILQTFYNTVPNQQSIFVKINFTATCSITIEVLLKVKSLPIAVNQTLQQCKSLASTTNTALFFLNEATPLFQNNNVSYSVQYYLNTTDLQNNIALPTNYQSITNPQNITVKIIDSATNCSKNYVLTLQTNTNPARIINPIETCETATVINGITNFDLTTANLNLTTGETFDFYTTENDALNKINKILNTTNYANTTAFNSVIYVRIDRGINCSSISELKLIINKKPKIDFELETDLFVCLNKPIILKAGTLGGFSSDYQYLWKKDNVAINLTTSQIQITVAGNYSVEITDNKTCTISKKFIVNSSDLAIIQNITSNDFNGNSNTILINYSGNGDYEFSLNGINFQDSNYFTDVPPGEYNLVINDKKGCGVTEAEFFVLSYPTFFTPNDDGYNDVWKIQNIATRPNSRIELYNRFGKLLGNFDTDTGWNGKFNQQQLPADDYWFVLTLENQKQIKGHFALKR